MKTYEVFVKLDEWNGTDPVPKYKNLINNIVYEFSKNENDHKGLKQHKNKKAKLQKKFAWDGEWEEVKEYAKQRTNITKDMKLKAIESYLFDGWDKEAPLQYKIDFMLEEAKKYCKGYPEWSDVYGNELKPLDDVSLKELKHLIKVYTNL
ncbi:hypothetical protein [Niallia sp. FSL M8-0099]|uniref:hypothetical protein n=1 Tax=Niallia sp. FSL M8-0099 TaxID=2954519 RepID=UPI0030FD1AC2